MSATAAAAIAAGTTLSARLARPAKAPPAPAVGTTAFAPSSASPISALMRQLILLQNTPLRTELARDRLAECAIFNEV